MSDFDYLFKVIVVGDGTVGKTALTIRFATGTFRESYKMTIGVDFSVKTVHVDGKKVKLQIWDTGGQERFSYIRPLYYKGAMGCLYVYDITNRQSFLNLDKWMAEVKSKCGDIPAQLVGNKVDLIDQKKVSSDEGQEYGQGKNLPFYETSAKEGNNVNIAFQELAKMMVEKAESSK